MIVIQRYTASHLCVISINNKIIHSKSEGNNRGGGVALDQS
jgi:hypothetical protein